MLEWLIDIRGPDFLLYFMVFAALCIIIAWRWANISDNPEHIIPSELDSVSIAYLRGGWTAVLRTVLFTLYQKKLIDIKETKRYLANSKIEIKSIYSTNSPSGCFEKEVYTFLSTTVEPKTLFTSKSLKEKIKEYCQPIHSTLQRYGLAKTEEDKRHAKKLFFVMAAPLVVLGGTKLFFGITRGKPIWFLVILLFFSINILYKVVSPESIPTPFGKKYVKKMKKQFSWMKNSVKKGIFPEGVDPGFCVALFGAGVLSSASGYALLSNVFAESIASSSDYGRDRRRSRRSSRGGGCGGGRGGCGGCGG